MQAGAHEITPAAPAEVSAMDLESMTEDEYMEWKLKVMSPFILTELRPTYVALVSQPWPMETKHSSVLLWRGSCISIACV
jgi:hypothetical protein